MLANASKITRVSMAIADRVLVLLNLPTLKALFLNITKEYLKAMMCQRIITLIKMLTELFKGRNVH